MKALPTFIEVPPWSTLQVNLRLGGCDITSGGCDLTALLRGLKEPVEGAEFRIKIKVGSHNIIEKCMTCYILYIILDRTSKALRFLSCVLMSGWRLDIHEAGWLACF
jgi:hypothetical protein